MGSELHVHTVVVDECLPGTVRKCESKHLVFAPWFQGCRSVSLFTQYIGNKPPTDATNRDINTVLGGFDFDSGQNLQLCVVLKILSCFVQISTIIYHQLCLIGGS